MDCGDHRLCTQIPHHRFEVSGCRVAENRTCREIKGKETESQRESSVLCWDADLIFKMILFCLLPLHGEGSGVVDQARAPILFVPKSLLSKGFVYILLFKKQIIRAVCNNCT